MHSDPSVFVGNWSLASCTCSTSGHHVITNDTRGKVGKNLFLHCNHFFIDTMLNLQASSIVAPYQPLGSLPDCSYIAANQPVPRPIPPTTASKAVKAALNKRKAAGNKSKDATGKKAKATRSKTVGNATKKK